VQKKGECRALNHGSAIRGRKTQGNLEKIVAGLNSRRIGQEGMVRHEGNSGSTLKKESDKTLNGRKKQAVERSRGRKGG